MRFRGLILILLFFLTGITKMTGQIVFDSIKHHYPLVDNPQIYSQETSENTLIDHIETRSWQLYDSTVTTKPGQAIWLKFAIRNTSKDTAKVFFKSEEPKVTIYQNGEVRHINGKLIPLSKRANKRFPNFTELSLPPLQTTEFTAKLIRENYPFFNHYPSLYTQESYWEASQLSQTEQSRSIGFLYFYIAALVTIFCFTTVFWIRIPEKLYLYYLGYLLFQVLYGFEVLGKTSATFGNFFVNFPVLAKAMMEPIQFIFIGFYILFILHLLSIKRDDQLLAKVLYFLGVFCFLYAGFRFLFTYFLSEMALEGYFFILIRLIILPLNFVLIVWTVIKVRHPLLRYFIVGQSFFFLGAVIASYLGFTGEFLIPGNFFNFVEAPNIVFQMGLLVEVFCFSIALGENIFLLHREKNNTQQALIQQFKKNRLLQEKMNQELDRKVNRKTEELIQLYSKIEREKEQKMKVDFTQKLKEMEMLALRSQMNPHFLFNSLNAIKHLIMTSRNDYAINYLDDFSSLLRGILQSSNQEIVTVEEELEILELYLSLEKNRMGENFEYNIEATCREELSQYYIPPLLLQPFSENAIWHGLYPSDKSEKKLNIVFDTTKGLTITIEDNGIGRKASQKKSQIHKSRGMEITKERLTLFNHLNEPSIRLKITDLEENNYPMGTRITLTYI